MLGNANKLGGKDASQYTTNDKFAVLTGSVNCKANTNENFQNNISTWTTIDLNFPSGFTSYNCVVVAIGCISMENRGFTFSHGFSGFSMLDRSWGTEPIKVMLGYNNQEIIKLAMGNYATSQQTRQYKVVLMKIS